ncbi:MAG TPA: imidazolonepropionase [Acidimicrobiales bacterium]|nr:imidazolonepropionase [Acidimicrobiales bacterium]
MSELTTNDPTVGDESVLGRLFDAAFVVDDEQVLWVGPDAQAPDADEEIDAGNRAVVPGFVDSHTHLVFAGERSDEFEARMAGVHYDGGGIARTVTSTRAASRDELRRGTSKRVGELFDGGVTTVEIKSGYELTTPGETRALEVASEFSGETTWMGAHVVPPEFANDRDGYLELLTTSMLDSCAPHAKWADVFCDRGAFSVDEAREVLTRARAKGLAPRLHANQLAHSGAIALAVDLDCASVDHCTYLDDDDIDLLSGSATVATLLPGAEFSTRSPYPSARRLLDADVSVALATDCNPGSSYVTSMAFVIALAVREMVMSVDEALYAATKGGALALRRDDVGHLGVGARADFALLDAPRAAHLAYRPGGNVVERTFRHERVTD